MKVFTPPTQISLTDKAISIFLAGTIDMGNSVNWQEQVILHFKVLEIQGKHFNIYNPRRANWDSSLEQTFECPQFYQQVNWELDGLNKADIIIMNFLESSKSPITLLELGLYATTKKVLVCCPKGFYRSGNVQIVCNNYNIPLYETMEDLLKTIIIK